MNEQTRVCLLMTAAQRSEIAAQLREIDYALCEYVEEDDAELPTVIFDTVSSIRSILGIKEEDQTMTCTTTEYGERFDLFDYNAIRILAAIHAYGASFGLGDTWRSKTAEYHLNHALSHIFKALEHKRTGVNPDPDGDDNLAHALCRVFMAVAIREREQAAMNETTASNDGLAKGESA